MISGTSDELATANQPPYEPDKEKKTWRALMSKMWKVVIDTVAESTFMGISSAARRDKVIQIVFWIVAFLASSALCLYYTVNLIRTYLEFGYSTNILWIRDAPAQFPQVAVCNLNQYFTTEGLEFISTYLNRLNFTAQTLYANASTSEINFLIGANALNNGSNSTVLQSYGFSFDQLVLFCTFNTITACNSSYFTWYYDLYYGNCFLFNSQAIKNTMSIKATNTGMKSGLTLGLFVGNSVNYTTFSTTAGARIVISNQSSVIDSTQGVDAPVGFNTNIEMSRQYIEQLSSPYSACVVDASNYNSPLTKLITGNNKTYTQKDCINLLFQTYLVLKCNCQDPSIQKINKSMNYCVTIVQVRCYFDAYSTFYSERVYEGVDEKCPLECNSYKYSLSVSSSAFPSFSYYQYLTTKLKSHPAYSAYTQYLNVTDLSYDQVRNIILSVNIYFNDLDYVYVAQTPTMDFGSLISNVGVAGLFLGCSFLSFAEIFDLMISLAYAVIEFYKAGKKERKVGEETGLAVVK